MQTTSAETYTPTGFVATETDADGGVSSYRYNALGSQTYETGPAPDPGEPSVRPVTTNVYDALERVTAQIDPIGNTTAYVYGFGDDQHTVTTLRGQTLPLVSGSAAFNNLSLAPGDSRTYDIFAQSSSTLSSDSGFSVSESGDDDPTIGSGFSSTTPLGSGWYEIGTVTLSDSDTSSTLTVSYSGSATITQVALLIQSTVDTYDADGHLLSTEDALGNTTSFSYNPLGLRQQQEDPSDEDVELGPIYDKAGNVASNTDLQNGYITEYVVNMFGQTVETIQPNPSTGETGTGPITTRTYDIDGELLSQSRPNPSTGAAGGPTTSYSYDAFGNRVSETDPLGNTTTETFDLDGHLVSTTDPLGNVTAFSYNAFGNKVSESLPDPANGTQDSGSPTTTYTFDATGNMLSLTDPDGNDTTWTYDGLDRKTAESEIVAVGYNSDSTLDQTVADSSYQYDLDGNLTQSTDADGNVNAYSYNSRNQETGETSYNGDGSVNTDTFSYDLDRNMLSAANTYAATTSSEPSNIASYSYVYGPEGVVGENIQLGGVSQNVILSSAYDFNGNRTSLSANIGGTMNVDGTASGGTPDFLNTYTYDALGDMTGITQTGQTDGNGVTAKNFVLSYDSDRRLTGVNAYQSDSTSDQVYSAAYSYDADSDLTDLTYTTGPDEEGTVLAAYHRDYGNSGLVNDEYSYRDTSSGANIEDHTTWAQTSYGYDDDGQLTSTTYTNFADTPASNTSQSYDPNGNRTNNGTAGTADRLLFDGTYYYTYDADGNRTARFVNTTSGDETLDSNASDITIYKWNNAGELVSATYYPTYSDYTYATGGTETDYTYDAFGEMVSRTSGGNTENYVYDGKNLVLVLNSSGQVTERELYAAAVDKILASETVAPVESGPQAAGTVNWLLTDNQSTVRDVAQYAISVTSVVDHLVYDSFGQITWQSNSSYQPRFTYAGMQFDAASGLYYDNARWYDPVNGLFISQDPRGFNAGDTNLSRYCGNSPTNHTDSRGLDEDGTSGNDGSDQGGGVGIEDYGASGGSTTVPVWGGGGDGDGNGGPGDGDGNGGPGDGGGNGGPGDGGGNGGPGGGGGPGTPCSSGDGGPTPTPPVAPPVAPPPSPPTTTMSGSTPVAVGKQTVTLTLTVSGTGLVPGPWVVITSGNGGVAFPLGGNGPSIRIQNKTPFTWPVVVITVH